MEALLVQTCESSTKPTARSTFQALTTMKLLVLMWSLLQPSSTPLWEKSLASSMNMPTLGRDPPSIHQVNLNGLKPFVDEKSIKVGGTQLITTLNGYSVPLLVKDGLAYATSLGRPTDHDMDTYPHVFFTSPDEWDPSVLDYDPPPLDGLDPSQVLDQPFGDPMFDAYGDFNERIIANLNILLDAPLEDCRSYTANLHQSSSQEPDWNTLRPFFAWTSPSSIQDTFNVTTRHGIAPHTQDYIKKHFRSRNPVFNIPRRSEAVATDTIFSDTPAVDDGSTMAQFFCGRDTLVCDAYGIKSTKQFINTLSDNIRKRGAMDTLISDGGKYEISKRVTDLLRSLFIKDYQSEPYHQHQNKAENRFGLAKHYTNTVMNTSGCPACCWLLCLQYICVVLNHLASPTLQGICPVQALEGTTPDISFLLHFSFYEPVYYRIDSSEPDLNVPSSSNEKKGYWVGFADNQGDSLTWRILTEDTQKIIIRSGVRSALRTTTNQRLASPSGEGTTLPFPIPYPQESSNSLPLDLIDASTSNFEQFVKSQSGADEDNPTHMANIDIPNLLGRSFLLPPEDNGECHMAKIIDIDDHGHPLEDIKFKLKINKDQAEEIMFYNQLMDYIQKGQMLTLKRSSLDLVLEVPSGPQQTSVLHHLQGRGPHFLFPFPILKNLQILCHLTLLMHQPPILSNLSKVSLVQMKIIQSPWPTLIFPIFLADPSFYHLRIMGSATWPKSLTLMTMDNILKTLNSS